MLKTNYLPIITNSTKTTFLNYIDALDIPQIDYFAIGVQDLQLKASISIMSLPEWQKTFVTNNYAAHDPLRQATLLTKRNIISFSEIDCIDNFGKEIMRQRSVMGIKNGLVLMERYPKHNYVVTLGSSYSRFDSYEFIKNHYKNIAFLKKDLINIISKDTIEFLTPPQSK